MSSYSERINKRIETPREQIKKKIVKKSNSILQQLYFNLINDKNRDDKWTKSYENLIKEINPELLASLKNKYQTFLIPK